MSFEIGTEFGIESAVDAESQRKKEEEELGRTDFLTMLVAQLENQDPLNPQDASEFSAQLAQYSSLEQLIDMKSSLDKLVEFQEGQEEQRDKLGEDLVASNLLGKDVAVFDDRIEIPEQGETTSISFYLDGIANEVDINVLDESGSVLYTIPAVAEDGSWDPGLNSFEWQRPSGSEDPVWGPRSTAFSVTASRGGDSVRGEGVSVGKVVASSMGFDSTLLELADGRRVDLEAIFEVRRDSGEL